MSAIAHSYVWHDSRIRVTRLTHMCDVIRMSTIAHSYVWHDSFICVNFVRCKSVNSHSFMCVAWLIHTFDVTRSYERRRLIHACAYCVRKAAYEWVLCATWLSQICVPCAMTHVHMCHHSFACATHLFRSLPRPYEICVPCAMTHAHMCHESFTCATWLIQKCAVIHDICVPCAMSHAHKEGRDSMTYVCHVPWLMHMCAMTYSRVWPATSLRSASATWMVSEVRWNVLARLTNT